MSLEEEKAVYTFIGKVSMVHEILAKAWEFGDLDSAYNPVIVALQSSLEQIKYALNHE